jgi:hypothetical protein
MLGVVIATPWPVTPEKAGEPFDPPPKEAHKLQLPQGASNLAAGKPVTSSVHDPVIGNLRMITDGDKGHCGLSDEGYYVEIGRGKQYAQIDLQEDAMIDAILIWHLEFASRLSDYQASAYEAVA